VIAGVVHAGLPTIFQERRAFFPSEGGGGAAHYSTKAVNAWRLPTMAIYGYLADLVVTLHLAYVLTVIIVLILIPVGRFLGWNWVRSFWLRIIHLVMIGIVAFQAWIGVICPLTHLENYLRALAGQETYSGTFVGRLVESLLYYECPSWVFLVAYTCVALLTALTLIFVPPTLPTWLRLSHSRSS